MKLEADKVIEVLKDCFYTEDEVKDNKPPEGAILVQGVIRNFGFNPVKVDKHKAEIAAMLSELPENFDMNKGGGWSFLNLCMDKNNNQWAEHPTMEALCVLAIATGYGKWMAPREMWRALPGGMPYFGYKL